ncbi:MAG TPA: M1 family aminopeptidase, partial [Vicinamibacterales bacterium]
TPMRVRAVIVLVALCLTPLEALQTQSGPEHDDGVTRLVYGIEQAIRAGDSTAFDALIAPGRRSPQLDDFSRSLILPHPSSVTVKERDRAATGPGRGRLMLEIFSEHDHEATVTSWRVDVTHSSDDAWAVTDAERLTTINGLYRLSLDTSVEYAVHDLVISAPDFAITVPSGHAFAASTPDGPTAYVVLGRGRVTLAPAPEAERGQLRLFSGDEVFRSDVNSVFIRLNPSDIAARITQKALTREPADPRRVRRAVQAFNTQAPKSFVLDLNDLSTDQWWIVPPQGDFVAELETAKYGELTYARAKDEPEDISLFDRRRKRNIAVYASNQSRAARSPFFSEDNRLDYDITRYVLDVAFAPDRDWIEGVATVSLHTRAPVSTLTLRLADPLVIRDLTSPEFGRLLRMRVVGQNNVLVGFPGTIPAGTHVDLLVTYGGRLPPQGIDREAVQVQQQDIKTEDVLVPPEPQYLYSNRSYWYPQGPVTEYATAKMTLTVPAQYDLVASGAQEHPAETLPAPPGQRPRHKLEFVTSKPARYLSVLISRFQASPPILLKLLDDSDPVPLIVAANPREISHVRAMTDKATEILRFYSSLMGDVPYDSFTLALTENVVPGGHSPAYFALVNEPLPMTQYSWTNDPVSFQGYPSFFVAHEIAHQWWGQAVGWKNYHEQWLSEGFAQYMAALYADHERGQDVFLSVLRQMRRTAIDSSPQGPVYLGYRLGHLKGDTRVFRALVYNKGAMVLHMLRRLIGDEAFFSGLREFYATWRYKKAGTDDFRVSMEKASGRPLERFFDRWIYDSAIPTLRMTSRLDAHALHVRFDQHDNVFDVPVTVSLSYADGSTEDVVVPVTEKSVDRSIPLKGPLRTFEVNRDGAALAEIVKSVRGFGGS